MLILSAIIGSCGIYKEYQKRKKEIEMKGDVSTNSIVVFDEIIKSYVKKSIIEIQEFKNQLNNC